MLYRFGGCGLEVLIVHPGGPLWARRDLGAWSIPKGEHDPAADPFTEALRELEEELGSAALLAEPLEPVPLGETTLRSGKRVAAFGLVGNADVASFTSNTFELEWPPRSERMSRFPEIDRAEWVTPEVARQKLNPAQAVFVDRLEAHLGARPAR